MPKESWTSNESVSIERMMLWKIQRPLNTNTEPMTLIKMYNHQRGDFSGFNLMQYDEKTWTEHWGVAVKVYVLGENDKDGTLQIHMTLATVDENELHQYTDYDAIRDFHQMVASN